MPSSPERSDAVAAGTGRTQLTALSDSEPAGPARWQPQDLAPAAAASGAPAGRSMPTTLTSLPVFELASAASIPPAVLEPARRAAEAAGYAAGWSAGMQQARAAVEEENRELRSQAFRAASADRESISRAMGSLSAAAAELTTRSAPTLDEVEQLIVDGAFAIAEALIGTVLRDDTVRGAAAVRRALAGVPSDAPVTVRVHPADRDILLTRGGAPGAEVLLISDDSLTPGDAIAVSGATTVDARISAGLDRVRRLLEGPA
jgi:flagellar assembly protein FliH